MTKVLCVAAHPDDEALGCGGTLARHASEGHEVYILICGRGRNEEQAAAAPKAAKILGSTLLEILDNVDNEFDVAPLSKLTIPIERVIEQIKPDIVYSHFFGDINQDHRRVAEAVAIACRPIPGKHVPGQLLAFEVPGSTEWGFSAFRPNVFIRLGVSEFDAKDYAIDAYWSSEGRDYPHPRNFEAVRDALHVRGVACGHDSGAEAFELIRGIA